MQTIILKIDEINEVNLEPYFKFVESEDPNKYFLENAGVEHYKLITYIARNIDCNKFVDIGTYKGKSALALACSQQSCTVTTFDICNCLSKNELNISSIDNIKIKICDCKKHMSDLLGTDFIVLDIDPHNGIEETKILNELRIHGYKGLVLLDDINLNDDMKSFWNNIPEKKLDVTKYGHWSGTGIVIFDPSKFSFQLE